MNTALITWKTSELSNSVLYYRESGSTDSTRITLPDLVANHLVAVLNLTSDTEYTYTVLSVDGSGNRHEGGDSGSGLGVFVSSVCGG